jgi:Arc/MetJ-type ribon-helix-helix transcriptional regulator
MQTTVKVAVSLPKEQFRLMERQRRLLKVSRSAAVRQAIHRWLQSLEEQAAIQQYIEGYRRHPESSEEIKAIEQASVEALQHETW